MNCSINEDSWRGHGEKTQMALEGRKSSTECQDYPGRRRKRAKPSKFLTKEEKLVLLNKNEVRVQRI